MVGAARLSLRADGVQDFAVEGIGASDNEVFAFLRFAVRMKSTGREASFHLHHYFRFAGDGRPRATHLPRQRRFRG